MGSARITSPLVTVTREGFPDDLTVQTDNRDLLLWDTTRIRHKWPRFDEAPSHWLTFISWAAARRTGAIPAELKYEEWANTVIQVAVDDSDDDGPDEIGAPFPGVAEPD